MYKNLEPREVPEGEREMTKTVYCNNEGCRAYEMDEEVEVLVVYYGTHGTVTYTCGSCFHESEHEVEVSDADFGSDTDEDWRSDK